MLADTTPFPPPFLARGAVIGGAVIGSGRSEAARAKERALRARLGIPDDAARVLVFSESSHWDPSWLLTSEEYYATRVRSTIERAVDELLRDPRRVYSLECLFFLKMHWERAPQDRDVLRALLGSGRLRLSGSGMTTPDTLIPSGEALIRDYLCGQEWLRREGLWQEPDLAYFPDSFGHSPALPALLSALGFTKAVLTRVDGMHYPGTDLGSRAALPLPGSTAHTLWSEEKSLDFVWRGEDGSEVVCHWNAFTYGQGDLLAHAGLTRWMGLPLAIPRRGEAHVARRIEAFVRDLAPRARTPYLLCPIGFDFVPPIRRLGELLEAHNRARYPVTGVYVVNAGMNDYLDLVDGHRGALPTLTLDPNPTWMGFYASRPGIKRRARRAAERLLDAEASAVRDQPLPALEGAEASSAAALARAWDGLVSTNHHDFITGTASDRVARGEQEAWLEALEEAVAALPCAPPPRATPAAIGEVGEVTWRRSNHELHVETPHYRVTLDERRGGCITSFRVPSGAELVTAPSNDLVAHRDGGGLWRMGHELREGDFEEQWRASAHEAAVTVRPHRGGLDARVSLFFEGHRLTRHYAFRAGSPLLRMQLTGTLARRRALLCRFSTTAVGSRARMDVPGGAVTRPARRHYDPTFWPCTTWARLGGNDGPRAGVFLGGPSAVTFRDDGSVGWIALRNATRERGRAGLPLFAFPVAGHDDGPGALDYAVLLTDTPPKGSVDGEMARLARDALREGGARPAALRIRGEDGGETDAALVVACKHAVRGGGVIARLQAFGPLPARISIHHDRARVVRATECDARERDRGEIAVSGGAAHPVLTRSIVTVRLFFETVDHGATPR